METPKVGGRYKRLADGSIVPVDPPPAPEPAPNNAPPADADAGAPNNPQEGD